ncbi:hypothetical protein B0H63DRAFT_455693 [Podospora didyma]|uniref:Uncharacterized protein n=1 Tax=Podospora didyma TaxID=330526 RepID=A0AAE0N322_9PEZI|nr:hypothetical protein B0H63DRAFT_455693 [Podospora didyma]
MARARTPPSSLQRESRAAALYKSRKNVATSPPTSPPPSPKCLVCGSARLLKLILPDVGFDWATPHKSSRSSSSWPYHHRDHRQQGLALHPKSARSILRGLRNWHAPGAWSTSSPPLAASLTNDYVDAQLENLIRAAILLLERDPKLGGDYYPDMTATVQATWGGLAMWFTDPAVKPDALLEFVVLAIDAREFALDKLDPVIITTTTGTASKRNNTMGKKDECGGKFAKALDELIALLKRKYRGDEGVEKVYLDVLGPGVHLGHEVRGLEKCMARLTLERDVEMVDVSTTDDDDDDDDENGGGDGDVTGAVEKKEDDATTNSDGVHITKHFETAKDETACTEDGMIWKTQMLVPCSGRFHVCGQEGQKDQRSEDEGFRQHEIT